MPHACRRLPHKLSVISTPPCLPRPCVKARAGGGLGALLFSRQPSQALRKLEQEQVGLGFDCGICKGVGRAGRGERVCIPVGAGARLRAETKHPAVREQGVHNMVLEHTQHGPFAGYPGGVLSAEEYYTPTPECARDGGGDGARISKGSPVDREELEMRIDSACSFNQGPLQGSQLLRVDS